MTICKGKSADETIADEVKDVEEGPSCADTVLEDESEEASGDEEMEDPANGTEEGADDSSGSGHEESTDGSECSDFEGDGLIEQLEAPVTLLKRRYRAIPLTDFETQRL
ncbi:hypothetical protein NKR19_g5488 [Coniochaeta hoffmannii]|uniref:Uncharacterized protein n=1 Tax=Coniochaeta hoffmannii TaxID=91930 RepID=A0AA38RSF7_9PEZI|nr:hypothetical protein NKR19_g5488 [Coniochaeta hoffmannii]